MASKKRGGIPMARLADKYQLYLDSVQSPDHEVDFFERAYRAEFDRQPTVLREDFCGTAAVCYEWVKSRKDRRAVGVDLDPEPLAWGVDKLLPELSNGASERIKLMKADVRDVRGPKADIVTAQNFSFYCFMTRAELLRYFRAAYRNLAREGIFVLDMLGGPEAMEDDNEETKKQRGYTYVFEQQWFDPISNQSQFWIHFRFPDGSQIRRAFGYHWRMWTIPEVREVLAEAGFADSKVYWENTDRETGEGNGVFRVRKKAESEATWISYIVARK